MMPISDNKSIVIVNESSLSNETPKVTKQPCGEGNTSNYAGKIPKVNEQPCGEGNTSIYAEQNQPSCSQAEGEGFALSNVNETGATPEQQLQGSNDPEPGLKGHGLAYIRDLILSHQGRASGQEFTLHTEPSRFWPGNTQERLWDYLKYDPGYRTLIRVQSADDNNTLANRIATAICSMNRLQDPGMSIEGVKHLVLQTLSRTDMVAFGAGDSAYMKGLQRWCSLQGKERPIQVPPEYAARHKQMRDRVLIIASQRYYNARIFLADGMFWPHVGNTERASVALCYDQIRNIRLGRNAFGAPCDSYGLPPVCICMGMQFPHRVCGSCYRPCECKIYTAACLCKCVCVHPQAGEEEGGASTSTSGNMHSADTEQPAGMRMADDIQPIETPALPGQSSRVLDICAGVMRDITPAELFSRWNHLSRFTWEVAKNGQWIVQAFDVTKQLQATPFPFARMIGFHAFFKCDLKFKIQVNTNRFQVGRLALVWAPPSMEHLLDEATTPGSVELYTTMPHVVIDAAIPAPATMKVPYTQIRNYISTLSGRNTTSCSLGRLAVVQLTALYVPTDSKTSVQGTVWVSVVDTATRVPTAAHKLFSTAVSAQGEIAEQLSNAAGNIAQRTVAGAVRTGLAAIPKIGPMLDRPLDYEWMTMRRSHAMGPLCLGDGRDCATRLTLHAHRADQNRYRGGAEQMHAAYLTRLSSVVLKIKPSWLTGSGEQMFALPVHPRLSAPPLSMDTEFVQAGFLNYVSSMFQYWRGALTFHVEVVCSMFATGRFAFTWIPDMDQNILLTRDNIDDLMAFPTVVLDIGEAREITFSVPFIATTPVKIVPTIVHTSSTQFFYSPNTCNGVLVMHVVNEMVNPPTAADYVGIWIWLSGGDDFELFVPAGPFDPVRLHVSANGRDGDTNSKVAKVSDETMSFASALVGEAPAHKTDSVGRPFHSGSRYDWDSAAQKYYYNPKGYYHFKENKMQVFPQGGEEAADLLVTRVAQFRNGDQPMIGQPTNLGVSVFGEDFMDLKALLKRRMLMISIGEGSPIATFDSSVVNVNFPVTPLTSMTAGNVSRGGKPGGSGWIKLTVGNPTMSPLQMRKISIEPNWDNMAAWSAGDSFLSLISRIFVFYSGSLRYSILSTSDVTTMGLLAAEFIPGPVPSFGWNVACVNEDTDLKGHMCTEPRGNYAAIVDNRSQNPVLEVEVPIQGLYDHLYVRMADKDTDRQRLICSTPGSLVITSQRVRDGLSNHSVLRVYAGAGNDFQLYLPAWAPPLTRYLGRTNGHLQNVVDGFDLDNPGVVAQMGWEDLPSSATLYKIGGAGLCALTIWKAFKSYQNMRAEVTRVTNVMEESAVAARVALEVVQARVEEVASSATRTMSSLDGSISSTSTNMIATLHSIQDVSGHVGHLLDKVHDGLVSMLMEMLGPQAVGLLAPGNLMNLIFLVYDGCKLNSNVDIIIFIGKIATTIPSLNLTKSVISYFSSLKEPTSSVEAQGDTANLADIFRRVSGEHVAAGSILVVLVMLYCKRRCDMTKRDLLEELQSHRTLYVANVFATDLLATFTDLGKISMTVFGISRAYPLLNDLMIKILAMLKGERTEMEIARDELETTSKDVIAWADAVVQMNQDHIRLQMAHDSALQREAQRLFVTGKDLFTRTMREGVPAYVGRAFQKMLDVAQTLDGVASRSKDNLGYRREPFCYVLAGTPGVGKTALVRKLACFLGIPEHHGLPEDSYSRSTEDEFWSGYAKQHCTIYDDFPKTKSPEGNRVMHEFINVKSCNPYPLNMADLTDKGMFFTSRVIGITTNAPYHTPDGMLAPDAFLRRRDLMVMMTVEGGVDDGHTHANARFWIMDPMRQQQLSGPIGLEDLKKVMMQKYIKHCQAEGVRMLALGINLKAVLNEFDGLARQWVEDKLKALYPQLFEPVTAQMGSTLANDKAFCMALLREAMRIGRETFLWARWGTLIGAVYNDFNNCINIDLVLDESHMRALFAAAIIVESHNKRLRQKHVHGPFLFSLHRAKLHGIVYIPSCDEHFNLLDLDLGEDVEPQGEEDEALIPSTSSQPSPYRPVTFVPTDRVRVPQALPLALEDRAIWAEQVTFDTPGKRRSYAELVLAADTITRCPEPISAAEMLRERFSEREWAIIEAAATRPDTLAALKNSDRRVAQILAFHQESGRGEREILESQRGQSNLLALQQAMRTIGGEAQTMWQRYFEGQDNWWRAIGVVAVACVPIGFLIWMLCLRGERQRQEEEQDMAPIIEMGPDERQHIHRPYHVERENRAREDTVTLLMDEEAEPQLEGQTGNRHLGEDYQRSKKLRRGGRDKHARKGTAFRKRGGYTAQIDLDVDKNLDDMMRKVRSRQTIEIVIERHARRMNMMGVIIGGRVALFPAHYFVLLDSFKENIDLTIILNSHVSTGDQICKLISCKYSEFRVQYFDDESHEILDLCAVLLPVQCGLFPKISSYFLTDDEIDINYRPEFILDVFSPRPDGKRRTIRGVASLSRATGNHCVRYRACLDQGEQAMVLTDAWYYEQVTHKGECGSLLYVKCPHKTTARIAGMHVAGNSNSAAPIAWSVVISRELAEEALLAFEPEGAIHGDGIPVAMREEQSVRCQGAIEVLGKSVTGINIPRRTAWMHTELWSEDLFPHEKELSVLRDDDARLDKPGSESILWKAVCKYGEGSQGPTTQEYNDLMDYWTNVFRSHLSPYKGPPLSYTQALHCPDNLSAVTAMDPRTSAGYPYVQMGITKRSIIEDDACGKISLARKNFDKRLELAKVGSTASTVWMDILKDEKRPVKRVKAGETRAFIIAPIDLNILTRCYYLEFVNNLMNARNTLWMQLGINPESSEWHLLANRLVAFGGIENCYDADYKNFDGKVHGSMWLLLADVVNNWAKDGLENGRIRKVIANQLAHRFSIAEQTVYYTTFGNPSGCALTTVINSFTNATLLRIGWYRLVYSKRGLRSVGSFDKYILDINYGDDVLFSTRQLSPEWLAEWLDQIRLMGHILTDGSKDGPPVRKHLEEVTFLKRYFKRSEFDGFYYGALEWRSIYAMLHFVKRKGNYRELLENNIHGALRAAFFHGRKEYDELVIKLKSSPALEEYRFHLPPFEEQYIIVSSF
uniref:Genome polyprotein n=2 Tax=Potato cyst nematode picorna-like virus TaxID=2107710 RepID=A0A2P1CXV7_9VIRU|nr:polyprotein [Potato cyst nematode picorna-like virus]AVK42882.1 polyprotein [Potato cyst nematode picorna-like virus]